MGPYLGFDANGSNRIEGLPCNVPHSAMKLRSFQKRFLKGAFSPGVDTAALSIPRGNGKSWLAAHLLTRAMTPGDELHQAGAEYLLLAASLEQARLAFRFTRADLEPCGGYRFIDSVTRLGVTHEASNTKLRVLSSNARAAFGIVRWGKTVRGDF